MNDLIPLGWVTEELEPGKLGVWNGKGQPLGVWDRDAIRAHFAELFA